MRNPVAPFQSLSTRSSLQASCRTLSSRTCLAKSQRIPRRQHGQSRREAHTKVQAIKWSLGLEFAQNISIFWARTHLCQGSRLKLFLSMLFPKWMNTPTFELQHTAPFYIPAFFVDAIIRAKVLQGNNAYDVPISIEDGYFNATDRHPLAQLQLTSPDGLDVDECELFDKVKHSRLPSSPETPVTILPFRKSPLGLLALRKKGGRITQSRASLSEQDQDQGPTSIDLARSSFQFFTAYPVYVPLYLSRIRCTDEQQGTSRDITVALVGHGSGSPPFRWASRAFIYDPENLSAEESSSGWRGYASGSSRSDEGATLIKSTFSGQPVGAAGYQALLETPWYDQVDMSACADPDDTWQSSPAVMDYLKCSDSNKDYFERLWAVEEARAYAKSLDYMDDDVKAIKLDMYNRKVSKLAKEDIKHDLEERIANLESEAREAKPVWFSQTPK